MWASKYLFGGGVNVTNMGIGQSFTMNHGCVHTRALGSLFHFLVSVISIGSQPSFDPIDISKMNTVSVNGVTVVGNQISMRNGVLYVDGKPHDATAKTPATALTIAITGDVAGRITTTSGDVTVTGNVTHSVSSTSGDINVEGSVHGSAQTTSGDVSIQGDLTGDASTVSGDVRIQGKKKK
jgi:hypothetical protein